MENFVVSARKYRPKGFDEVVGQSHITTTLKNAIDNNQLAQALLFCGPRGVGKTTCARIMARLINGFEEGSESTAMNIFELDAASNNSVDDIRQLIDQVRYPPQFGKYKVYIIDEVHMLSTAAFNAFLKTLEEPPSYAIFILATTEKHKVIPTILSRCQIFDFNRIQVSDIADHLKGIASKEGIQAEEEALHLIARKADGALRDALSIFDLMVTFSSGGNVTYQTVISNLHILDYEYYFRVVDALLHTDHTECLLIFDEILQKGFDGHNFIVGLAEHLRNLLVSLDPRTVALMDVPDSVREKFREQAGQTGPSFLLTALNIANQCDIQYKGSKNQRLHVELCLMKMAHIPHAIDLAAGSEVKKKTLSPGAPDKKPEKETASLPKANATPPPADRPTTPPETKKEVPNIRPVTTVAEQRQSDTPRKIARIPRLDELARNGGSRQQEEKDEAGLKETFGEDPFTVESLRERWEEFTREKKEQGKDVEYTVLKQDYYLKDDHTIVLQLTNSVKINILDRFRSDLTTHLKKTLNNRHIRIETELLEEEQSYRPYTNKEKFDYLAEKKPVLKELKERLGLDPDL